VLRVVALQRGPQGIRLAGLASVPGGAIAGRTVDAAVLCATVRRASRGLSWRPRRTVMGVSAGAILLRALPVDAAADDAETADAVERAARTLPVQWSELRLTSAPVDASDESTGRSSRSVLMVAARREPVLARQRLAAIAGLGRVLVDVEAFAAMRAVTHVSATPVLLLDAGSDSLRALVWAPGHAPCMRLQPLPRACHASELAALVARTVGDIGSEGVPAPAVAILAGGRMGGQDVPAAIEAAIGVPCRLADPFAGLSDVPGSAGPPPAPESWLVAVGLARRGLA
jgi:Tfp pilus assembly PilM family ATPase